MRRPGLNLWLGGVLALAVLGLAFAGLVWTPFDPAGLDILHRLAPPGGAHVLGTDEFGRDVLSRVMTGAGMSLSIAATTVVLAVVLGAAVGLAAGFYRGWLDRVTVVLTDALLAFPGMLLALGLIAVTGPSREGIVLALGLAYLPKVVRIARGTALSLRQREFVEASRALGNARSYTLLRHVLPNALTPIAVFATSMFGWVILVESALSFLGLGVPPPAATWGNMLSAARPYLQTAPWLMIVPGLFIMVTLLAVNLLGDALRDWLDPRL